MSTLPGPMIRLGLLAAALTLTAACSSSNKCKKACDKMEQCLKGDGAVNAPPGGFTCQLSATCNAREECQAACYSAADCAAIFSGKDATLSACLASCASIAVDGGADQGPPKLDKGPIKLDHGPCTPACNGRQCGPDGCGGSCGSCNSPQICSAFGQCVNNCTPSCSGKQCGPDSCGGTCGTCTPPAQCNAQGQCFTPCTPSCAGKVCGDNGCGGSCGTCTPPLVCDPTGQCVTTCSPACAGKQCGPDGCGGSCGTCSGSTACSNGVCGNKTVGTGDICTNQNLCIQPTDTCMFFATGATKGMCLSACTTLGAACATPNPTTQFAACALTDSSSNNYCGFICELNGTTYSCPNAYDFDCTALDPTAPTIKICVPKP